MENSNTRNPQEEIDLWDILKKCFAWLCFALTGIIQFLLKKWSWILGFILLGIIVGFAINLLSKKHYHSNLLIQSKNVNSTIIIERLDALDALLLRKDTSFFSKNLRLSPKEITNIKSIKGLYAIDVNGDKYPDYADVKELSKKNPADTSLKKMKDFFYLHIEVYSNEVPTLLLNTLKMYIDQDSFCVRENNFALDQQKSLLKQSNYQLNMLDSLQKNNYSSGKEFITSGQQLFLLTGKERESSYYKDYIDLYTEILKIEKNINLYSEIMTPMQDFPPLLEEKGDLFFTLKTSTWISLLLGILGLLIWDNRKKIKTFVTK